MSTETIFKSALDQDERMILSRLEVLAQRWEKVAYGIRCAIDYAERNETIEGIDEMVAMAFNSQQYEPSYGGGGGGLPPGDYTVCIVDSSQENVEDKITKQIKGGYLAFELTPLDGPLKGSKHTDRLNLMNSSPVAVEIANKQLSAYCHVTGKFQFQDTSELHNIPFKVTIGFQKGQEPTQEKPEGGYTEVKAIYDINGNKPGQAGAGPQAGQQQQQQMPPQQQQQPAQEIPAGVQQQGGGWGGQAQQPPIDNNVPPPGQQQQPPQQEQPPAQGGWGGQAQGGQQQPPPAQGGWGKPA